MIPFCVGGGFVVRVHLQGRFSFDPSVRWVFFVGYVRSAAYILCLDPFALGKIFVGRYALNVTLVSSQFNFFLTNDALSPSALVCVSLWSCGTYFRIQFVDVSAVGALFNGFAYGSCFVIVSSLEMMVVTVGSVEISVTYSTWFLGFGKVSRTHGLFDCEEVVAVFAFAGRAPFTDAWMMFEVVVIVPSIAIVAEVRTIQEAFEGITSVVMVSLFDETYDLV